jgi:HTH-type transcriptional regulator/antitoxin HigA
VQRPQKWSDEVDIHPIRTPADYEAALAAVSTLVDMDPARSTPEGEQLESLAVLVEKYEAEHFPMAAPHGSTLSNMQRRPRV